MNIKEYLEQGVNFVPAVVGFLIKDDEVLLGLRKKVSLGLGENLIAGIGGKLEKDETDRQAFKREVEEEIKVKIKSIKRMGQVRFLYPHKPKWQQEVTIYLVDAWDGEPQETEAMKPLWFKRNELPTKRMWKDNLYWLPKILVGERVNGTFLYDTNDKIVEYILEHK